MKINIIWLCATLSTTTSYSHMYLKNIIDSYKNIIIAKVISLEAKDNNFSKAEIQTLEILKGSASSITSFKPNPSWIRNRKNIHNGEKLILLFNEEKRNHTIPNFIRMYSFLEDGIIKTELFYWIIYPVQLLNVISKNDSIYQDKFYETRDEIYNHNNHHVVPFDTLLQIIKSSIVAPPLLQGTKRFHYKFIIAPNIYQIEAFINDNNNLNLIDSIALFDCKYLPGLKEKVLLFNLGRPNEILQENEISTFRYSGFSKDFLFKNDSLISIRELPKKRALKK